jgi:predicted nucleic acid-binding protein
MLDNITDESQIIEFPDYVIYEIINQIVKLVLENSSNPRIQTNPVVSKSIA